MARIGSLTCFCLIFASVFIIFGSWTGAKATSCDLDPSSRIDCYPETAPAAAEHCHKRGCCYIPYLQNGFDNVPWCFYPSNYTSYVLKDYRKTKFGYSGVLSIPPAEHSRISNQIETLRVDLLEETPQRLRFLVRDANAKRYEVPIETPRIENATVNPLMYTFSVKSQPFGLTVRRKNSGSIIFDTTIGPIIYADQYLQISSALPSSNIYGLGERHEGPLISTKWKRIIFWTRDQSPDVDTNLYGSHPFYMGIEDDGNAFGVFLLNSNAMEAEIQPSPSITFRTTGGILDFYIFVGPTPEAVVEQYTQVVGRPVMPPYWGLGFHLCRWGYNSSESTQNIADKMRAAKIPQDVQWNDIDYMDNKLDFTFDKIKYKTLPDVVKNFHDNGLHYVMIIDPGISNQQAHGSYPAYDDGIAMDIFVKDPAGFAPIEGQVWPGKTVFPDFTHPNAQGYWQKQLQLYHDMVPFDGVWIDMNEPSNFADGSTSGCPSNNTLENPPYTPHVRGGKLSARTLCVSALQNYSTHYNVHSLTGMLEMRATSEALMNIRGQRPFIISRSTFPSAGKYGGHWNGDVLSTWHDLKQSISSVINFNIFGIPLVGADICGFATPTNEELCIRWMQLGAFYPFSRNHNNLLIRAQAPVDFSLDAQNYMRSALNMRYLVLPYLYTLFHASFVNGTTVARGLFSVFPTDKNSLNIDEQFMWGEGLLISPVVESGRTKVNAYFPSGLWFEFMDFGSCISSNGQWFNVDAPIGKTVVHFHGGSIIPGQLPALNTVSSRKNPFILFVAPDKNHTASGSLYWDDGTSLLPVKSFLLAQFRFSQNTLISSLEAAFNEPLKLGVVYFFNSVSTPKQITLNDVAVHFEMMANDVLKVELSADLNKRFVLKIVPV